MLVATGGYAPLTWGLFGLIALAGQWLGWREKDFGIVPTISLALSAILLVLWPEPTSYWFTIIGGAMAMIHAVPLLLRLWQLPPRFAMALELAALSLAIMLVPGWHFYLVDGSRDAMFALLAGIGALLAAMGAALGWNDQDRPYDARFAVLVTIAALLSCCMFALLAPDWPMPIGIAAVATLVLLTGERAGDARLEWVASAYAIAALIWLVVEPGDEALRLAGLGAQAVNPHAIIRWLALCGLGLIFAIRVRQPVIRALAQMVSVLTAYGAIAQVLPQTLLPLVPPLMLGGLALASARLTWPRIAAAIGAVAALIAAWSAGPVAVWTSGGLMSLVGEPMVVATAPSAIVKQVLIPALLLLISLRTTRGQLPLGVRIVGAAMIVLLAMVSLHSLYRIGFARVAGGDFMMTGLAERVIWASLLMAGGWALGRGAARGDVRFGTALALVTAGTLHAFYYTLILHNPLWTGQAVGAVPLANLLIPAFGLSPLGLSLLMRKLPEQAARAKPLAQALKMVLVTLFAFATLRQAFVGTVLVVPGVSDPENILRSILAIALAIGFLLWGIRCKQRNWRIASLVLMLAAVAKVFLRDASGLEGLLRIGSFVALGFSLIGIGWLYSRQLRANATAPPAD
jgi:hypothetical protein